MTSKRPEIPTLAPDYVRSISERAASIGIGEMTLRRLIKRGEGPATLRLSPGRIGIRDSAWSAWLASREQQPGKSGHPEQRPAA